MFVSTNNCVFFFIQIILPLNIQYCIAYRAFGFFAMRTRYDTGSFLSYSTAKFVKFFSPALNFTVKTPYVITSELCDHIPNISTKLNPYGKVFLLV